MLKPITFAVAAFVLVAAQADEAPSAQQLYETYRQEDEALRAELEAADQETLEELGLRVRRDQKIRQLISTLLETPGASPQEAITTWVAISRHMSDIDRDNTEWLKARLQETDWFTISEFGEDADKDAFLIVQHAVHDVDFMRDVSERFERLAPIGEIAADHRALLVDRLAVLDGRPQPFGSQWTCREGSLELSAPIADPETVDARRAEVGLPPLDEYRAQLPRC